MTIADRVFGILLIVASLMHVYGSIVSYKSMPLTLVWALSGALAGLLVAGLNLLRVGRPSDRPLALMSLFGCIGWIAVALGYGNAIGNILDPRPMTHVVVGTVLAAMSVRTLRAAHTAGRQG